MLCTFTIPAAEVRSKPRHCEPARAFLRGRGNPGSTKTFPWIASHEKHMLAMMGLRSNFSVHRTKLALGGYNVMKLAGNAL